MSTRTIRQCDVCAIDIRNVIGVKWYELRAVLVLHTTTGGGGDLPTETGITKECCSQRCYASACAALGREVGNGG